LPLLADRFLQDSTGIDWQLNACGSIDVSECTVRLLEESETSGKMDRDDVLEVTPTSTERHFYLAANDKDTLARWVDDIRKLVAPATTP